MAAIALTSASLQAAPLYWAPNGQTPGPGGAGTWNLTDLYWAPNANGSGTLQAWPNVVTPTDSAVFGGTSGIVEVSGTVRTTALSFTTGGYQITGGSGGTGSIYIRPSDNVSTNYILTWSAGSGATSISSNISLDVTARNGQQARYVLRNQTAGDLAISSNISFAGTSGSNTKWISFSQENAAGSLTFSGNIIDAVTSGFSSMQIGTESTVSTAKYYFNGDNSGLTNGNSADLTRGVVYLGNAKAMGNGTVRLGNGSAAADSISLLTNASLTVANNISTTGDAGATRIIGGGSAEQSTFSGNINLYLSTTPYNIRLTAVQNGRVDFSGVLSDNTLTGGSVTKVGAGIVRLTNAAGNTYDGGTTVSAGTLIVTNTSNSATGTAGVQVTGGATLGGTGRITGLVTGSAANSVFSAGDMAITGVSSIGTLNLLGGLSATTGSTFKFDLNGATSDTINFGTGPLTLSGTVTFDFANLGTVEEGTTYTLFTGTAGTWSNTLSTFVFNGPSGYDLDSSYGTDGYLWDATGRSLTVRFEAIPEPTTSLLIGLGLSVVLFARRKHTRLS